MRAEVLFSHDGEGWCGRNSGQRPADLVLYFGTREAIASGERYRELRSMFAGARIIGCSTGGQIQNGDVSDDFTTALALKFDATHLRAASAFVSGPGGSFACGEALGKALAGPDLAGVFVLSDGLNVNGSALVAGIASVIGNGVPLTGGLAGDGAAFERTLVGLDCEPKSNLVGAVGFYGKAIRIGHGSAGGWDVFGPRRRITQSAGNTVFEFDDQPALDLYERYLGEEAKGLPGTALLFPLRIWDENRPRHDMVRTVLAVDHARRSLTFAGDMPEGWRAQLMRGSFDRLVNGAAQAARQARNVHDRKGAAAQPGVALLVSCIGRRLLMGQRAGDEVEAVTAELGSHLLPVGFYSYGEISPHSASGVSELHNQTMTVTAIAEAAG